MPAPCCIASQPPPIIHVRVLLDLSSPSRQRSVVNEFVCNTDLISNEYFQYSHRTYLYDIFSYYIMTHLGIAIYSVEGGKGHVNTCLYDDTIYYYTIYCNVCRRTSQQPCSADSCDVQYAVAMWVSYIQHTPILHTYSRTPSTMHFIVRTVERLQHLRTTRSIC